MRSKGILTLSMVFLLSFLLVSCAPSGTSSLPEEPSAETQGSMPEALVAVDQTVCGEAAVNRLCDGLDIAYGEGYQQTCCSDYGRCCSE